MLSGEIVTTVYCFTNSRQLALAAHGPWRNPNGCQPALVDKLVKEFYFKVGTHTNTEGFSFIILCTRNLPGNPFKHTGTEIPMGVLSSFGILVDQSTQTKATGKQR